MEHLSKQQESFCENAGLFGMMISAACLIQHLMFMIPHWITFTIIVVYVLCIAGFVLLMKKALVAPRILFISVVLVFLLEALMILTLTFSLVLLILLVYLTVIVALLYTGEIPRQLKQKSIAEKEEEAKWNGIV